MTCSRTASTSRHLPGRAPSPASSPNQTLLDVRGGQPSDLDDWVAIIADFESGATGVLESTKLATGRGEGGKSPDVCEVNGSEGNPRLPTHQAQRSPGRQEGQHRPESDAVPEEFLKVPGPPRLRTGDPVMTFRWDQNYEFIDAIVNNRRPPQLRRRTRCQAVMDAAVNPTNGSLGRRRSYRNRKVIVAQNWQSSRAASSGVGGATPISLATAGWDVAMPRPPRRRPAENHRPRPRRRARPHARPPLRHRRHKSAVDRSSPHVLRAPARIDALVNAAGTNIPKRSLAEMTDERFREVFDVNLTGALNTIQAVPPRACASRAGGHDRQHQLHRRPKRLRPLRRLLRHVEVRPRRPHPIHQRRRSHSTTSAPAPSSPATSTASILEKRPTPPPMDVRTKMLQPQDLADCVMLVLNLPSRASSKNSASRPGNRPPSQEGAVPSPSTTTTSASR